MKRVYRSDCVQELPIRKLQVEIGVSSGRNASNQNKMRNVTFSRQ